MDRNNLLDLIASLVQISRALTAVAKALPESANEQRQVITKSVDTATDKLAEILQRMEKDLRDEKEGKNG